MRSGHLLLFIVLIPSLVVAQYDSNLGRFRVDEIKGCAPLTVNILDTNLVTVGECTALKPCIMFWGDGTDVPPPTNTFTHTYEQPGTYTMKVLYQTIGFDEIEITVTPNIQPAFDIYTCGSGEVQVKVTDTNYDAYFISYDDGTELLVPQGASAFDNHTLSLGNHTIAVRGKDANADDNCSDTTKSVVAIAALAAPFIDQLTVASASQIDLDLTTTPNTLYRLEIAVASSNPANFQLMQTIHDVSTASLMNLQTDNNYYGARLGAFDPCNNTTAYSNIICSANFDLSVQNNVNNLTWTSSTSGVNDFTVNRDGNPIGSTGGFSLADNNVVCGTEYCYQLITTYTNGSQSISLEKCGVAFSSDIPAAINNVTAVVSTGQVDLTWQQDPAFQVNGYSVFRSFASGNFQLLDTTPTTQYTDTEYTTNGSFCYRIDYEDMCGNTSAAGTEVCPIRLTGIIVSGNDSQLSWNDYNGWQNGVDEYVIEKYDANGQLLETFNTTTPSLTDTNDDDPDNQVYRYIVKANANASGLGQAISNEITLTKSFNLIFPTAFTPNGDNLNDIFKVSFNEYVVTFELKIFNRWGELLFTTTNLDQGWDGKFKGTLQPEGTYIYTARVTDLAGQTFNRSGSVVLIHKK